MGATHGKVRGIRLNLCAYQRHRLAPATTSVFPPSAQHISAQVLASVACIYALDDKTPSFWSRAPNQLFARALRLTSSTAAAQAIMPAIATASSRSSNNTNAISEV